jgi:hypothetical protein
MDTGFRLRACGALLSAALSAGSLGAFGSEDITAVSSRIHNGYQRTILPDGSFRAETYGFGVGGELNRSQAGVMGGSAIPTADSSIDGIDFASISQIIQGPLATQKYLPTGEPRSADLLILVYWGRTIGTNAFTGSSLGASNGGDRDATDLGNARLLGFDSERLFDQGFQDHANMMANIKREVYSGILDAVEDDRYYVILQAYDFQELWKRRNLRLLWETRFSLSQRHHDFRLDLPAMTHIASEYFGRDTQGLVTKPLPEGHVNVGELRSLGEFIGR